MRTALAAALGILALALAGPAQGGPSITYAALGDSVAAGYGLGGPTAGCGRSPERAYPALVARNLERRHDTVRFVFLACSGATAAAEHAGPRALETQVARALELIGDRRALVSITIGINDLEWWNLARVAALLRGDRATYDAWVERTVGAVGLELRRQLRLLLDRPRVRVVLTDYFDPVNHGSPLYVLCSDANLCRDRVAEAVGRLNAAIRGAAKGLGGRVRVAGVGASFEGHEAARPFCGSAPPGSARTWIQRDCLHPNDAGAAAIATRVDSAAALMGS